MISIVIFAAGRGTRLGASVPKFLVEVDRRPIFMHQLDALRGIAGEIYVVCGYRAAILVQLMLSDIPSDHACRKRLTFIHNDDFEGPQSGSICRALTAIPSNRPALFIDGDMLFQTKTVNDLISLNQTTVALREIPSKDGVMAKIDDNQRLRKFARNTEGAGEWANLAFYEAQHLPLMLELAASEKTQHHFDLLNQMVDRGIEIQTAFATFAEVDDVEDLHAAGAFVREHGNGK